MLWKFPSLPDFSFRPWFEQQAWAADPGGKRRAAWEQAQTGYPLVDAAMIQLWKTGWMPNYMRHIVPTRSRPRRDIYLACMVVITAAAAGFRHCLPVTAFTLSLLLTAH